MILLAMILIGVGLAACALACRESLKSMVVLERAMDAFYRDANRLLDQRSVPAEIGEFLKWLSKEMWKQTSFFRMCMACHYSKRDGITPDTPFVDAIDALTDKQREALFDATGAAMVVSTLRTPVIGSLMRWRVQRKLAKGYAPNKSTVATLAQHIPHAA